MPGYAGKILKVDLSEGTAAELSTLDYAERFLGGRGIAAGLYWEEGPSHAGAFDPTSTLVFATGPLAGVPAIGGSRWVVCGKSPATNPQLLTTCNLGGDWGLKLKSAGWDAILVRGRAETPTYLLLRDGKCEFRDASHLWGRGAIQAREDLKAELGTSVSVVAIGPAGENRVTMATLLADGDASGSGGLGAVMGSKNLKAIAVQSTRKKAPVANPAELEDLIPRFRAFGRGPVLVAGGVPMRITGPGTKKAPCFGCVGTCLRRTFQSKDGMQGKFMCQSATIYQLYAEAVYGPGHEMPFRATKLCDDYGLDTMALAIMMAWLAIGTGSGILDENVTGLPMAGMGTIEFFEDLVKMISMRRGFGDALAEGVEHAAKTLGPDAEASLKPWVAKAGQPSTYDARIYVNAALLHATEPKAPTPQLQEVTRIIFKWLEWRHQEPGSFMSNEVARRIAKQFWGSEVAADYTTIEGKALAAKMIQDREYAKECIGLCSFLWPIMDSAHTADHVGDPTLEAQILSAVTGQAFDEGRLNHIGERVFNLTRAIHLREGHRGIADDTLPETWYTVPASWDMPNPEMVVPGPGNEVASRQGAVVDRARFEKMRAEYYQLRGWDASVGTPTGTKLDELALREVATEMNQRGLLPA